MTTYIPQKGDFITLTFDPQSGHEQRGPQDQMLASPEMAPQGFL